MIATRHEGLTRLAAFCKMPWVIMPRGETMG